MERWRFSTFVEFNYAVSGYWRNWERFAALPMREICYVQIAGNPNIKQSSKPRSARDYISLSIDGEKKTPERPTDEEIEQARKEIFNVKKV